jgi:signal transduction histidine kinase
MNSISAILNKNRKIVYLNIDFLDFLGLKTLEPILGKRHGDVVSCMHSGEGPSGCGTSLSCKYCGAVNTILESQITNQKSVKEASISSVIDGQLKSWDLKITTTPITIANREFYVLTIQDISKEKRLMALERIFLHDLLNTASGLNGLLTILKDGTDSEEAHELITKAEEASLSIVEEIMQYGQLQSAEKGDIQVRIEPVNSIEFLISAIGRIRFHEVGKDKLIEIAESSYEIVIKTDRILLQRIIINLLKNAFEASPHGGVVKTGADNMGDKIRFWVKNDGVIARDVQMQIFQRSFSTKGKGRGIGTYSIRLLTENYLKGKVSFISNENEGTIFFVDLYKDWI